jgi:hypothetical protein
LPPKTLFLFFLCCKSCWTMQEGAFIFYFISEGVVQIFPTRHSSAL